MHKTRWFIGMIILLLLVACGNTGNTSGDSLQAGNDDNGAVQVVKDFIAATKARDVTKLISLMEPSEEIDTKGMSAELRTFTSMIEQVDMQDETYTVEENDGEKALVHFTAKVSFSVLGGPNVTQDAESLFTVVKKEDRWYIRTMQPMLEEK